MSTLGVTMMGFYSFVGLIANRIDRSSRDQSALGATQHPVFVAAVAMAGSDNR